MASTISRRKVLEAIARRGFQPAWFLNDMGDSPRYRTHSVNHWISTQRKAREQRLGYIPLDYLLAQTNRDMSD